MKGQSHSAKKKDADVLQSMHEIKEIGKECYNRFSDGDLDWFGHSLHKHWVMKKKISGKMSSDFIDKCYNLARLHGALGGKIMGAGGGGFLMFYKPGDKTSLVKSLTSLGLKKFNFSISRTGTTRLFKL